MWEGDVEGSWVRGSFCEGLLGVKGVLFMGEADGVARWESDEFGGYFGVWDVVWGWVVELSLLDEV